MYAATDNWLYSSVLLVTLAPVFATISVPQDSNPPRRVNDLTEREEPSNVSEKHACRRVHAHVPLHRHARHACHPALPCSYPR